MTAHGGACRFPYSFRAKRNAAHKLAERFCRRLERFGPLLPHVAYKDNARAVSIYERAGFREIGRRRDAVLALGRRSDSILMDATPD